MKLPPLKRATFLRRVNRFVGEIVVSGKVQRALIRNTGRLKELLKEGSEVFVSSKKGGKCPWEIVLVEAEGGLVCINSHLPPRLLIEFIEETGYPWPPHSVRREVPLGGSRIDLLINDKFAVETKSVNLIVNGTALFPDAPTERGRRHIRTLMEVSDSFEPYVVFVVQAEFAKVFSPNEETDPGFSETLREFHRRGFRIMAFSCRVEEDEIRIKDEIPVKL